MATVLFTVNRVLPHIWVFALLLLQMRHIFAAPTHHLTVSVEGNTPTLIVTSAEIGITPKIAHATTIETPLSTIAALTTTVASDAATPTRNEEFENKGSAPKLRGKSYKMQYSKKWQHALKEREKSKQHVASTQESPRAATISTNTEAGTHRAETIITTPKYSLKTTSPTITQTFEQSTQAIYAGKVNIVTSSARTLDAQIVKPTQVGNEPIAPDVVNTPDAIMSTVAGNMPQTTEPATKVTLASATTKIATTIEREKTATTERAKPATETAKTTTTETETAKSTTTETANIISTSLGDAAGINVEQSTHSTDVAPESKVAFPRDTTLAAKASTMPTFIELHDTTAVAATKHTTPKITTVTHTAMSPMATVDEQTSASTTSNVPMITDQIETLPSAITLMVTTTTTPLKTTSAAEVVTNAFSGNGSIDITKAQLRLQTSTPTANVHSISGSNVDVNQNASITQTNTDSTTNSRNGNEKVFTNISDNLETTRIPVAKNKVIAIKQTPIKVNATPTTNVEEMETQETNTLISTTTTTTIPILAETLKKIVLAKETTTEKVDTESGIIFIDDAADNREDKPNSDSGELQNDEAVTYVAGRHELVKVAHKDEDGVNDSKGVIKLIDLEKHDLKAIAKAKQHKIHDDGHDGVKRTRKKQLTDKHYLVATELNASAEIHDESTTAGTLRKEFVDTAHILKGATESSAKENSTTTDALAHTTPVVKAAVALGVDVANTITSTTIAPEHSEKQQTIKQTAAILKPTLMPVHNGYLGPILMEEKHFTVLHAKKKPHEHHESTIESQLRDGRIVEILAPTALLEQTTTKPQRTNSFKVNKAAPASTSTFAPARAAEKGAPMLSTTVFQVPELLSSTTRLPLNDKTTNSAAENTQINREPLHYSAPQSVTNARTESKISDIQVEVYDSTVDSIVASTNFKDSESFYRLPLEAETEKHIGTTKPPAAPQERFTQYVVDRVDYATQEASPAPLHRAAAGIPEPAAIEIHINVSEGIGNESEDLEFSYRQPDYAGSVARTSLNEALTKTSKLPDSVVATRSNESNNRENIERGDEILVVEIIDTGENSTEAAVSAENINPIFTFRSDPETDVELKDIKYFPPEVKVKPPQLSDELFLADMKRENALPKPPLPPPPPPRKPTIDRDSDTIFYISNTEVKVGESLPTTNTNFEQQQQQQLRKTKLENQFFPANYLASTHPNAARLDELPLQHQQHRYEEDIILSPIQNTADSLKIFRSQGSDGAPPLDVTYVGESVMEVEQSSGAGATTTITASIVPSLMPDVIIQPAILPEMSIGVPVIGELPPQIELKEIDFMPDEANQQHSGMYENNMLEENGGNGNGNDVDKIAESSVQYGGDLIDETAVGGGFDGVEGSYPFGNPAALHNKAHHAADYAHFIVNHGVNNLRKNELSVDVASSGEMTASQQAAATATMLHNLENGEMKELLERNSSESLPLSMLGNGSYPIVEHISNATAKSVIKESNQIMMDEYSMLILILVGLLLFVLVSSGFCALWIMYIKYQIASVRKPHENKKSENGKNVAENGKSEDKSTIDTATSISKEQLLASIDSSSNGNAIEATQHAIKPSSYNNNKNMSNGTNATALINCNAKSVEEVLLLPSDEPIAIPAPISMSTPLKLSDNNKLKTEVNVNPSNSNSVQDDFTRPNGSVTKMTMKNNHLIVETEERHDISRDARETTMHYNTAEKDGVFVVEVARGVDSKSIPGSPTTEEPRPIYGTPVADAAAISLRSEDEKILRNHDEIQIHQPPPETIQQQQPPNCIEEMPERSLHQIVELDEAAVSPNSFRDDAIATSIKDESKLARNSNTGLSQSDLSSTSSTDSNKRYSYGNQELYTVEPTGYVTSASNNNLTLTRQSAHDVAEDEDRRSENGHSLAHSPAAEGNGNATGRDEQAVCNKLANTEQNNEEPLSNNAMNASQREDNTAQADNNMLERAAEKEKMMAIAEAALEDADDIKELVNSATDVVVEAEGDKATQEATEQAEDEKKEDAEEMENNKTEEPVTAVCGNNNNPTTEDRMEQLESKVSSEDEIKVNEIPPLPVLVESEENRQCAEIVNTEKNAELTNAVNEPPHAFPQPTVCNYGYDSIISLPDPPSTEEIKQLAAFSIIDNNQLDSLPPPSPPPPPVFADVNDNTATTERDGISNETTTNNLLASEDEITATQLKLQQILHSNSTDATVAVHTSAPPLTNGNSYDATNGNITKNEVVELDVNGHDATINGHEHDAETLAAHTELNTSSSNTDDNSTGTPLTPPASPPLSSPLHYTDSVSAISAMNGVNRGICNGPLPVAVNVNGS